MIRRMYINKSNKLTKSIRFTILQRWHNRWKVKRITERFGVSAKTVYNIINKYKNEGINELVDHKPGPLRLPLNANFYANIVDVRNKFSWGACRIEKYFKKKGYLVSHNKINQVIQYEGLTRRKLGKQSKPSYVSYEADKINYQWHTH